MNEKDKDIALFRLMVLGPLTCRSALARGELKKITGELAAKSYCIPYSQRCYLSSKTIERWYYRWLHGGFEALAPRQRSDSGRSNISESIQSTILELKKANPSRSLNTIKYLLETQGIVAHNEISRASLHRFLQKHQLSKRTVSDATTIERRSFEATHAGDIWQGDVMHGPTISTSNGKHKVYLVSLIDDASRLITHSAFCFGETALDIEGVLKQALLKRGIPRKLIIDNGAAYRAKTLQMICAQLGIRLIYCPPYEPEGKGKLERWHRMFREQFLSELILDNINTIDELNARLWAWLEQVYHQRPHSSLAGKMTPITRWRNDLIHVRPLGVYANSIDHYFYHRIKRQVKKDGTVTWEGVRFEVPYELVGNTVNLVIDPHEKCAVHVESLQGAYLGATHPLNKLGNCYRQRQRPKPPLTPAASVKENSQNANVVELAHQAYKEQLVIQNKPLNIDEED